MTEHPHEETVTCSQCGYPNKNRDQVRHLRQPGRPVLPFTADAQERQTFAVPSVTPAFYDKDPRPGVMRDAKE